jgi:hypothetical protein
VVDQIVKEKYILLTMLVPDIDYAIEFYVNGLGLFELHWDSKLNIRPSLPEEREAVVLFSKKGVMFGIHFKVFSQSFSTISQISDHTLLSLPVDDIDLAREHLKNHGIRACYDVELPFQASLIVRDPFGNKNIIIESYLDRD